MTKKSTIVKEHIRHYGKEAVGNKSEYKPKPNGEKTIAEFYDDLGVI